MISDEQLHSSSNSRPGMYSKLTSNITGLFGATLGLAGAELRPFGNANYTERYKINNNYNITDSEKVGKNLLDDMILIKQYKDEKDVPNIIDSISC